MTERICSEDGCSNTLLAKGLCGTHYARLRRGRPGVIDRDNECRRGWRAAGPGRDLELRRLYGITLMERNDMAEAQGYRCAICYRPESESYNGLHVDHDHATGEVRGLLCRNCNVALGKMLDDPERLRAAAAYLERDQ